MQASSLILAIIKREAIESGLPWEVIYAICQVESSMNPYAFRYEPQYRWLVGNPALMEDHERMGQMSSWGLMQVMGGVAREYGLKGWFDQLWVPEVGIQYGTKHLLKFMARHHHWPDAITSYNAGSPIKIEGRYRNQGYVDKVLRIWNDVEMQVDLKHSEA